MKKQDEEKDEDIYRILDKGTQLFLIIALLVVIFAVIITVLIS